MSRRPGKNATVSPLRAQYAQRLAQWRVKCGGPSFRDLARQIGYPPSTMHDWLTGGGNFTWQFVQAYVSACDRHAGRDGDPDLATWRWDFDQMLLEEARAKGAAAERGEALTIGIVPARVRCYQARRDSLPAAGMLEPGRTVVLTGLGGAGKTQLAVQYTDRIRAEREVSLVVWVEAGTRAGVVARFAEAAQANGLAGDHGPEADAGRFVAWLAGPESPRRWLIVLDDVTDLAALHDMVPHGRGNTIITTRRRGAGFAADDRDVVEIGPFTPEESVAYLRGVLGRDDQDAELLATELGHLPLALAQAATFIVDHHLDCHGYLARLRAQPLAHVVPEPGDLPDDQITPVMATWTMSIDAADRLRPIGVARPLLELAAVLDPGGIPIAAFTAPSSLELLGERLGRPASADDALDGLSCLERQSLGQLDDDHRTFRVHQLLQRAVRESLTADQLRRLVRRAADAVLEAWPQAEQEGSYAILLRANAAALALIDGDALWAGGLHQVVFRAGNSLTEEGLIGAAVEYWERLLPVARDRLGPEHPDTLIVRNNLAWGYGRAGDGSRALRELRELLPVRRRVLGELDSNTLATRHGIAQWLIDTGEAAEAVAVLRRLIADYERAPGLGPDHRDTLNTRHLLADALGRAGPASAAVEALRDLLGHCRRALGEDAPITLDVVVDLAWWLAADGSPAEGVTLIESAVPAHVRAYGAAGLDTFAARHLAAELHGRAGEPGRAAADLRALLADVERALGPDHPMASDIGQALDTWSSAA